MRYVSSSDFDSTIKLLRNQESNYINKIVAVVSLQKMIAKVLFSAKN